MNNLILKIGLNQGIINLTNSKINWKNDLEIIMKDGTLDYTEDGIILTGRLNMSLDDIGNFYQSSR